MKLADMTVNVNKNGTAQKEIEGCLVQIGFNVNNGAINSLNARIHQKGENSQLGTYLGEVNMNPATGKVSSSFVAESEDFELEFALKVACKVELAELRLEVNTLK
jgi:hypothetical protein